MTIAFFGATPVTSEVVAEGAGAAGGVFDSVDEEPHPAPAVASSSKLQMIVVYRIKRTDVNGSMCLRA